MIFGEKELVFCCYLQLLIYKGLIRQLYLKNINVYDNFIIIYINISVCILVYLYYIRCYFDDNVYLFCLLC